MKTDKERQQSRKNMRDTKLQWVENPHPEGGALWEVVKLFLLFFLATHSIVLLASLTLGLTHPLTLIYLTLAAVVPVIVLGSAFLQFKRAEPDDLYLSNHAPWLFRIWAAFMANIALIVSVAFDTFPLILSALLIACVVIELMAYFTYRSYSDDMIREIMSERGTLSPVNENNEFWFINRGGDVGSDRLFIKGKWHLRLLYAVVYITPFAFVSGGKASGAIIAPSRRLRVILFSTASLWVVTLPDEACRCAWKESSEVRVKGAHSALPSKNGVQTRL